MDIRNIDYIDENLYSYVYNGLRVYIMPKKGYSKKFAMITVNYGSNDICFSVDGKEEFKTYPLGIAHFLEHKLFEEQSGNIFDQFSKLGASPNAYTNFENTAYYFTCTDNFYESLKLLINFVFNPYFTEENVQKEKGIIEQEIRMYDDNPGFKIYSNALLAMYNSHPLKNDIAGTVDSVYSITPEMLYKCYNTFYNPNNMILVIVGDVDENTIKTIVERCVPDKGHFNAKLLKHEEPINIKEKQIKAHMGVSIPNCIIGYKDAYYSQDEKYIFKRNAVMSAFGKMFFSKTSKLYEKLYEEGLINESFSYDYVIEKEYAHFLIGSESKDPIALNEAIIDYFEKTVCIEEDELNRIKKSLLGSYVSKFNSIEGLGNYLSRYFINNIDPFSYKAVVESIKAEDVEDVINNFIKRENNVLSVVD